MAVSDEEFAQWYSNLSPSEQQQFQYTFAMSPQEQAGQLTGGFPVQPEFDFGQDLGNVFDANIPQLTTKGAVDPYDLSQAMSRLNYTQDVGGSMFDLAQTMFAGPDAWGDPAAFEPITTYTGKAVPAIMGDDGQPRPATASDQMLDDYITNGGFEGAVAEGIKAGMTPSNAIAAVRKVVTDGATATNLTPAARQHLEDIRSTMPMRTEDLTDDLGNPRPQADRSTAPWQNFDEKGMIDFATGLYKDRTESGISSATLQFDPKTGQYYEGVETEDSPTALKFRNAGLPTPFERFDDPEYIEKAMQSIQPGYQNDVAAFQGDVGQQATDWNALADEYVKASRGQGQMQEAWNKAQPETPDPLLAALGNRGAGTVPTAGRFAATNAPMMAASERMPTTTAFSPIRTPSPAQQASQQEGSLASQFRINPADVTPEMMDRTNLGPLGGAQPLTWNPPEAEGAPVFFRGDDKTPHLITTGEGVRFSYQQPGKYGTLNRGDVKNATNKTNAARKKSTDAYNAMYKQASQGAPGDFDRAYTAAMLRGQARSGQTPLQVAMLARLASLGQRAGLGG